MLSLRIVCRGLAVVAVATLAACHSTPPAEDVHGLGVVAYDRMPPSGVEAFGPPQWMAGDRFVFRRGGAVRLPFRVVRADQQQWVLQDEETGREVVMTPELAVLGERAADGTWGRQEDPLDAQLHWPLWVGKRWTCSVVRKVPGTPPLPLVLSYRCDARETVQTPAGTFDCLRIWRTARVAAEGDYYQRTALLWYAPAAGWFVRRLEDGVLIDLDEILRQTKPVQSTGPEGSSPSGPAKEDQGRSTGP